MELGPVVGVRRESPADKAGFREGDVIVSMAGADIGDPLTLGQRLLSRVGQPVEFGVRRAGVAGPGAVACDPRAPDFVSGRLQPGLARRRRVPGLGIPSDERRPGSGSGQSGGESGSCGRRQARVQPSLPRTASRMANRSRWSRRKAWLSRLWRRLTGTAADEGVVGKDLSNWYFVHSILNLAPRFESGIDLPPRCGRGKDGGARTRSYSDQFFYPARRSAYQAAVARADGGILVGSLVAGLRGNRSQRQESVRRAPATVHGPHFVPQLGRADHDYPGGRVRRLRKVWRGCWCS